MSNHQHSTLLSRKSLISLFPYTSLVKIYNTSKKRQGKYYCIIENIMSEKFFSESPLVKDFSAVVHQVNKTNKWCIIKKTKWNHPYVNICFISEVLSLIIWCLENGYKPVIDIKNSKKNDENLWEKMFLQPFDADLNEIKNSGNYIVCPFNTYLWPDMQDARKPQRVDFWNKMYNQFVVFNDECQEYLDNEQKMIIKDKKVLGCLIRGIEYEKLKFKGHPIQPSIADFIAKIKEVMAKDNLDYIYLATEDETIANRIKETFGGIVLENKREYYDKLYRNDDFRKKSESYDRDDGAFLKALEYMSSINLVSKCDSFVGGLCGGSEAAEYFNGNQYKTNYIFDRGVY